MAPKNPFTFTGEAYIKNKTGDGSVLCRQISTFEQISSPKGTYAFKLVKTEIIMSESEQLASDQQMMHHTSEKLSDYCSHHPESSLWNC